MSVWLISPVGGRKSRSDSTSLAGGCLTGETLTRWNAGWLTSFSMVFATIKSSK